MDFCPVFRLLFWPKSFTDKQLLAPTDPGRAARHVRRIVIWKFLTEQNFAQQSGADVTLFQQVVAENEIFRANIGGGVSKNIYLINIFANV